jgi:hypothetical protein
VNRIDTTSTSASLWFALLAGPLAWTAHELLSYALVKVACGDGLIVLEYMVAVCVLALVAAGALVAVRAHGAQAQPPQSTREFVTGAAIVLNALFGFAILMETIPDLVVNACL